MASFLHLHRFQMKKKLRIKRTRIVAPLKMFRVSDPLRGVLICENVEVVNVRGKGELEGLHAEKY